MIRYKNRPKTEDNSSAITTATMSHNSDHSGDLAKSLGGYCLSTDYSDVTLIVENEHIPAHKVVLAAGSDVFRGLLSEDTGGIDENEIEIENTPLGAFKVILKYIYSGRIDLSTLGEEMILKALDLTQRYGLGKLKNDISTYLNVTLEMRNACTILNAARLYDMDELINACHNFMDKNAEGILEDRSFFGLSIESLHGLMSRDSFFAPEGSILKKICKWCEENQKIFGTKEGYTIKDTILKCVRLQLISSDELLNTVRMFACVNNKEVVDALLAGVSKTSSYLPYRGNLYYDVNVASKDYKSTVIEGEKREFLLDSSLVYNGGTGYTYHIISNTNTTGIVVQLGKPYIINYIEMLLYDEDNRSYSYHVDVSGNNVDWFRVVDRSKYYCRSWQNLYFQPKAVKYIKIVGKRNTVNEGFHLVSLQAKFKKNIPPLVDGILKPDYNVATLKLNATVLEGLGSNIKAVIDGDWVNYDGGKGFTYHLIGKGAILIQLAQPYMIGSLKMRLYDQGDRTYSYYIETSTDKSLWEMAVDKRNEACKSWQELSFTQRQVSFIKLVGTKNTANEGFHVVHLECPFIDPKNNQSCKEAQ